ncbi:MAG: hypothetical protein U0996_09790 [Planctomycetaceae bacterium]
MSLKSPGRIASRLFQIVGRVLQIGGRGDCQAAGLINASRSPLQQAVCSAIAAILITVPAYGQSADPAPGAGERFSGGPLLIMRNAKMDSEGAAKYIPTLIQDLNLKPLPEPSTGEDATQAPSGMNGVLLYLVPGVIPSVGTVTFREVKDRSEFQALVLKARSGNANAKLTEDGDTYTLIAQTVTTIEPVSATSEDEAFPSVEPASLDKSASDTAGEPETEALPSPPMSDAQDTPKGTISIGVSAGNNAPPGVIFSVRSSEVRDGEVETVVTENRMVYRYSDGFMFESTSDGLKTAELPAGDSLRQLENADVFSEFAFYADRVPPGIKQLGWGMISAGMGTDLQQRDEEPDTEYETRRALGDAQLIFLQSMIFDLQKVSGWVRMASEVEPLEAQLRVATRENSDLAKRLRELSSSASYFGPILNDDAIVTFHVCLMVPEHWRKFLKAAVNDLRRSEAGEEVSEDYQQSKVALADAAERTIEEGQFEFIVKYGWTPESGPVFYYALHLRDAGGLENAIRQIAELDTEENLTVDPELGILAVRVSEPDDDGASQLLDSFAIAASSEAVWFAYGSPECGQMLGRSIRTCQESQQSIRTPLVTFRADPGKTNDKNVPANQKDFVSDSTMLDYLLSMAGVASDAAIESGNFSGTPGELFRRAGQLGGTQDLSVTADSDESGLIVRVNAGAGLVRGFVALFLALADAE